MFSFYFVLFGASATDVLANYLSISLNVVLTAFRFLAIAVPLIVYPVTYRICKEMQQVPTAGKRKRANVVLRSAEGGYSTVRSEERPATPFQKSGSAAARRGHPVSPGDGRRRRYRQRFRRRSASGVADAGRPPEGRYLHRPPRYFLLSPRFLSEDLRPRRT